MLILSILGGRQWIRSSKSSWNIINTMLKLAIKNMLQINYYYIKYHEIYKHLFIRWIYWIYLHSIHHHNLCRVDDTWHNLKFSRSHLFHIWCSLILMKPGTCITVATKCTTLSIAGIQRAASFLSLTKSLYGSSLDISDRMKLRSMMAIIFPFLLRNYCGLQHTWVSKREPWKQS